MKNKFFFLLSVIFSVVLYVGCSKSDNKPDNGNQDVFMRCKFNGKLREFAFHVNANDPPSEKLIHFVVVSGREGEDIARSPGFGFSLVLPEGAQEKTYEVAGGLTPELDATYFVQNYNGNTNIGTSTWSGGRSEGTSFKLTITSLSDWGVKGKFSGLLKGDDDSLITVTDGEFSAPYNYGGRK